MYYIKKVCLICSLLVFFNGCTGQIVGELVTNSVSAGFELDAHKPIFLEEIENDEFQDFVINTKIIKNIKKQDIIYLDNVNSRREGNPISSKILLTNNYIYFIEVDTWQYLQRLNVDNYKKFDYNVYKYGYNNNKIKTNIDKNLLIINISANNPKWYERKEFSKIIKQRYNNIHKIKEIIDERVAYHKKNRTYDEDKNR